LGLNDRPKLPICKNLRIFNKKYNQNADLFMNEFSTVFLC